MGTFLVRYRTEVFLFLLIFLLRVVFFAWLLSIETTLPYEFPLIEIDSREYHQIADNLIENGIFSLDPEPPINPDSFRTPGYPLFLAGILVLFKSIKAVSIIQALISGFIGVLMYWISRRVFNKGAIGFLAALIFAFEPSGLFFSNMAMSETLFLLLLLLALYIFLDTNKSKRKFALVGLLLGLCVLVRPIAILLPFIFILVYLLGGKRDFKKKIINSLIILIIFILVLSPWVLRNKIVFDSFGLSSISSYNLYYYNAMRFFMLKEGVTYTEADKIFSDNMSSLTGVDLTKGTRPSLVLAPAFRKEALNYIKSDMVGYVKFHLTTLVPFFLTDGLREIAHATGKAPDKLLHLREYLLSGDLAGGIDEVKDGGALSVLFLIGFLFSSIVTILSFWGVIIGVRKEATRVNISLLFLVLMYLALFSGVVTTVRFRYAVSPIIFLLAAHGLYFLWQKILLKKIHE